MKHVVFVGTIKGELIIQSNSMKSTYSIVLEYMRQGFVIKNVYKQKKWLIFTKKVIIVMANYRLIIEDALKNEEYEKAAYYQKLLIEQENEK